jgi:hypothetical protein
VIVCGPAPPVAAALFRDPDHRRCVDPFTAFGWPTGRCCSRPPTIAEVGYLLALEEHNWSIGRLAPECSALGNDTLAEGTMRNAVNGIDPMRPGRIRVICKVTAKYGDGIPYGHLVVNEDAA